MARPKNKKQQIIDAAIRVLNCKEYHEYPVDEIAREAGIAKGTIYLYFTSKEELFFSVFSTLIEKIRTLVEDAGKNELPPKDRLAILLEQISSFVIDHHTIFLVLRQRMGPIKGRFSLELHRKHNEVLTALNRVVEQGIRQKDLRDYPAMLVSTVFLSLAFLIPHQEIGHKAGRDIVSPRLVFDLLYQGIGNCERSKK
jgi:TetR/AcrR family fatty acid metabolism transcriptional regulator